MLGKIIDFWLKNKILTLTFVVIIIFLGLYSIKNTPMDAIPDIGENQIIVYANWAGRSPQDMENQVTYPLTINLMGIPKVKVVRSISQFGLSMVYVIFEDGVDYYWGRTRILEKLDMAQKDLPEDVIPLLGPDGTGLGQVFWYTLENGYYCEDHPQFSYENPGECPYDKKKLVKAKYDLGKLRSVQDWYVKYQFMSVKNVAETASIGGHVRQYQIDIDPNKLNAYSLNLKKIIMAVKGSNIDVGAKTFEENNVEYVIRGLGFLKSLSDIENIIVGYNKENSAPIFIKNIANVTIGPDFRRGALDKEGAEAVGGVVLMRYGANPLKVIEDIKLKIKSISPGLPPGIVIKPFYDRTNLIHNSISTLKATLIWEIVITMLVIVIFLLHFRASLVISLILPLGIVIGFIFMRYFNVDSNIMSLGGIAIAIGVMVDAGIVVTENIYRKLSDKNNGEKKMSANERLKICSDATKEVAPSIIAAIGTTIVSFLPVFALPGQSGKLFRPLAYTKTFTMLGAGIIVISLIPLLSYYLLRGKLKPIEENIISQSIRKVYKFILEKSFHFRKTVLIIAMLILILGIFFSTKLKKEFMPPLDEGDLLFMPVTLPGASLSQVMDIMQKQDRIIKSFPEVERVVGKLGRADTATDPAPISMIESIINLKPKSEWREGMTKEKLVQEMNEKLKIPGVSNIWTQPIRNRIDMLSTGIQTPIGIKVFGDDIQKIQKVALKIEKILNQMEGVTNVYAERIGSRPYLEIMPNRQAMAQYGISMDNIQNIIMMGLGGMNFTTIFEGRERYPLRISFMRDFRDNYEAIKNIPITSPLGYTVPLKEVADVKKTLGPAMLASENTQTYSRIFINIDPEKIGTIDFVENAKKVIENKIKTGALMLPPGYFISWSGQYIAETEARERLKFAFPIVLFIIILILYFTFESKLSLFVVLTALPISLTGGIILLYIFSFKMSVAIWVGFIALFGIATDNAVVLVNTLDNSFCSLKNKEKLKELVVNGALLRIRPIIMTTATTILALIPIFFTQGAGSEIMRPMALPTIGGLFTATLSNTILVPVIYLWLKEKTL